MAPIENIAAAATAERAAGTRYRGAGGEGYWTFQEPIGRVVAERDRWKIEPFLTGSERLLEFGCGGGFLLERLPARQRIGIEINDAPRQSALQRGLDVRRSLEDVEPGWADVVWSHHALEHVLTPYEILTDLQRTLRPGGQLRLVLPIDDWRLHRHASAPDINGHLWTWTPLLIHNLLHEIGFVDVGTTVKPYSWPRGARLLVHSPAAYHAAAALAGRLRRCREIHVAAVRS